MGITINDIHAEALARQLARLTGENIEEAVRNALRERLESLKRGKPSNRET